MRFLIVILCLIMSSQAVAWHTSTGKIKKINVYSATDAVLVSLKNSAGDDVGGVDVEECSNTSSFAISTSISAERRQQMLSILLMAKATDRPVSLSYSTAGGCVPYGNSSSAYRGIVRIIL